MILVFGWLLNDIQTHQPTLFAALVVAGSIGFSALLNGLVADPVERLRSRLRSKPQAGAPVPVPAPTPVPDLRRRPQSAAQPIGTIHRVP
ncbi:hypothetical protein D9M71_742460 [compost metagenome]